MEHVLGLVVRATATYVFLLLLLRVSGKRTVGEGTPFDLVVALVLGDFPDDLIWGEVPVAQGLVAMGTVMLAHLCVVYASFRSIRFDQLVGSGPVPVMRDGRALHDGLRRGRMNTGDLDVQLRRHGREDPREVAEALLEPDGEVSLRPTEAAQPARRRDLSAA
ncbi:MAG TPA: YetF domain-containing protein [Terriglobales bacterium]|nr:YetF domain-containing protein [Terriglobales bacterium]